MAWEDFELRTRQLDDCWEAWVHSELFDFENSSTKAYGATEEAAKFNCLEVTESWSNDLREFLARQRSK